MSVSPPLLLYSAAHAGFSDEEPLGGGKTVADYLVRHWQQQQDPGFSLRVLSPRSLGLALPRSLTALSAREYARFCRRFEQAATAAIEQHDPARCLVLSNDISEGPRFAALGRRGWRVATIVHVDVVEYFTRFYLRNLVPAHWLARLGQVGWLPDLLRLVFTKQAECVRHSQRIIVPSAPMKEVILRCYPSCPPARVVVMPWGNVSAATATTTTRPTPSAGGTDGALAVADDVFVILTLSRLSREKGLERLLRALALIDRGQVAGIAADRSPIHLVIGGAAAYMGGQRYARRLRREAARLGRITVTFTGHVTGATKQQWLQRADLFVSPSIHESYGLTIAEARAAGCPVISHHHYGASGEVVDCRDPIILATALAAAIARGRRRPDAATADPSTTGDPAATAKRLAAILLDMHPANAATPVVQSGRESMVLT